MYEGNCVGYYVMEERQKRRKHLRGVSEGTGQATRLRKSGKKRGRVRVLGGLLG